MSPGLSTLRLCSGRRFSISKPSIPRTNRNISPKYRSGTMKKKIDLLIVWWSMALFPKIPLYVFWSFCLWSRIFSLKSSTSIHRLVPKSQKEINQNLKMWFIGTSSKNYTEMWSICKLTLSPLCPANLNLSMGLLLSHKLLLINLWDILSRLSKVSDPHLEAVPILDLPILYPLKLRLMTLKCMEFWTKSFPNQRGGAKRKLKKKSQSITQRKFLPLEQRKFPPLINQTL